MVPQLTSAAWRALDELYQAHIEHSAPIWLMDPVSDELQSSGLAVALPDGSLEITVAGSQCWEERQRLARE